MNTSCPFSLKLIEAIEKNEHEESRNIVSGAKSRGIDVSSPVGALRVTALQFAAWRGWMDVLNALQECGADVNVSDKLGRCPLHYAAHEGNADVTEWLVQRGATLDIRVEINSCTRDVHRPGTSNTVNVVIGKNLPLPECWGRTPLHQAVRNNHPEVVRILVKAGAQVDVKDERQVTPLLLAGSKVNSNDSEELNKYAEIVNILVTGNASTNLVHPDTGSSALHHATTLGSPSATRILLAGGAWPLFQCSSTGSTALHIAAATGNLDTLAVLLRVVDADSIDIQDEVGRTALHRAAYQGYRECVELLTNYGGNLAAETKTGVSVIDAIFAHVPRPLSFLTELLDAGVRPNINCCTAKGSCVSVDFSVLAPKRQLQMGIVTALIGATSNIEQLGILKHPLLESFLSLKWSKLRGFFFILVLVHVFFVLSLSGYAIVLLRNTEGCFTLPRHVLMLCSCLLVIHNTVQVLMVPRYYLKQFETWSSLTSATVSLATSTVSGDCIIEIASPLNEETLPTVADASSVTSAMEPPSWVFHAISLAILFAWIQMMLLVGRFPTYGYYALMFSTVLKNILKVLLAFICLIVGFALSFSVLFHGNDQFRDSWRALVKTVVMMMGEYEYGDLFSDEHHPHQFQQQNDYDVRSDKKNFLHVTSRIVFLGFIVLTSIVLMNLMIGLAVNDIQGLEKEGHIRRLLKQAEFVAHLERVTSHRIFRSKWLHSRLRVLADSRRCISTKITVGCTEKYPHQSHGISSDLLEALFELAAKNSIKNDKSNQKIGDKDLTAALLNMEQLLRQLQSSQSETCRLPSKFSRSFVKRKVARRIRSTNA